MVDEVENHFKDEPWHERSATWLSQPPPELNPPPLKSSENQLPFRHPEGRQPGEFPPLSAFGPKDSFYTEEMRGDTRKRRARELLRLYERRVWTSDQDYDASWSDCLLPAPFMVANRDCFGGPAALRGYDQAYCKPLDDLYRESMFEGRTGRWTDRDQGNHVSLRDHRLWQFVPDPLTLEASLQMATVGQRGQQYTSQVPQGGKKRRAAKSEQADPTKAPRGG